jgi:hypothetical protein
LQIAPPRVECLGLGADGDVFDLAGGDGQQRDCQRGVGTVEREGV